MHPDTGAFLFAILGNTAQFKAHGLLEYYSVSFSKISEGAATVSPPELCGIALIVP